MQALSKEEIISFQKAYFKAFGVHLDRRLAMEKALKVLTMYQLIAHREIGLVTLQPKPDTGPSGTPLDRSVCDA